MKVSKYLLSTLMCATLIGGGAAMAQTSTTTTTTTPDSASTTTSTDTTPNTSVNTTVNTPAQAPEAPQTRVEIHNQTPASQPQATQPKIDIKMPDVNVQQPANPTTNTTKETVTEHTSNTYVRDTGDNNDADVARTNNTWMMVLFGVLAVLLIGAVVVGMGRRTTVIDDV